MRSVQREGSEAEAFFYTCNVQIILGKEGKAMFKTRITELFGIDYPIIAAPMQWLSQAELVSAVSNAGGLGIIASLSYMTTRELREEIRKTRTMTAKPFAVNVTLLPTARPLKYEEYFAAAIEEGVNIIETSGRSPEPYMKLLKDAKVTTVHKVGSVRHARTAERAGVDAVVAAGFEEAGHPLDDDVTTLVLTPACIDAVKIPVVAAGGIADARGFVAALALGADGVYMGTRFLASKECDVHPDIREWLLRLRETDTMIIHRSINNAERVVRTDYTQKILQMEEKGATLQELLPLISGQKMRKAYRTGDISGAVMTVGQAVGLIHDIPTVEELIDNIISEAKTIVQRLHVHNIGIDGKKMGSDIQQQILS